MIIPYLTPAGKPKVPASFLPSQLFQNGDLAIAKDQRQFFREPLLFADDCRTVFLFFRFVDQLERVAVCDMSHLALTEDPVQHAGGGEQPHVTAVQGRERAPADVSFRAKGTADAWR
jgi:hypothetical protein